MGVVHGRNGGFPGTRTGAQPPNLCRTCPATPDVGGVEAPPRQQLTTINAEPFPNACQPRPMPSLQTQAGARLDYCHILASGAWRVDSFRRGLARPACAVPTQARCSRRRNRNQLQRTVDNFICRPVDVALIEPVIVFDPVSTLAGDAANKFDYEHHANLVGDVRKRPVTASGSPEKRTLADSPIVESGRSLHDH